MSRCEYCTCGCGYSEEVLKYHHEAETSLAEWQIIAPSVWPCQDREALHSLISFAACSRMIYRLTPRTDQPTPLPYDGYTWTVSSSPHPSISSTNTPEFPRGCITPHLLPVYLVKAAGVPRWPWGIMQRPRSKIDRIQQDVEHISLMSPGVYQDLFIAASAT